MKKEYDEIDDLFKQTLDQTHIEFDEELVWDNIQGKKKKRRGFFMFFGGLLLFGMLFLGGYGLLGNANIDKVEPSVHKHEADVIQKDKVKSNSTKTLESTRNTDIKKSEQFAAHIDPISNNTTNSNFSDVGLNEKRVKSTDRGNSVAQSFNKRNINSAFNNFSSKGQIHQDEKSSSSNIQLPLFHSIEDVKEDKIGDRNDQEVVDSMLHINNHEILPFAFLTSQNLDLFDKRQESFLINKITSPTLLNHPEKKEKSAFSVALLNSVYKTSTDYTSESIRKSVKLNNSHSDIMAYSNELQLNYQWRKHIAFTIGIQRMQQLERFYWKENYAEVKLDRVEKAYFIINNDQSKSWVEDSVYVAFGETRERQYLQRLTSYHLPIGMRLSYGVGRMKVGTDFSLLLGLSHHYKGYLFNAVYSDASLQVRKDYFQKAFAWGAEIRPYVQYPISERLDLSAGLRYRWNQKRTLYSEAMRKTHMLGLDLSLHFTF